MSDLIGGCIPPVTIRNVKVISKDDTPIVTVEELGHWLNLSSGMVTARQEMLQSLIDSAEEAVQNYTWLTLHETVYESEIIIDSWDRWFTLERAPITDIGEVSYLSDDEYSVFDKGTESTEGLFENITERLTIRGWAEMHFVNPPEIQDRTNAYRLKVRFTAGLINDTDDNVPEGIKTAIKMIAAFYYTNRGDCSSECTIDGAPVPCAVLSILNQYSLQRTVL